MAIGSLSDVAAVLAANPDVPLETYVSAESHSRPLTQAERQELDALVEQAGSSRRLASP